MPANVEESAHLAGCIAQNDDALARHIAHEVVAGIENGIGPPGAYPVLAIERLHFFFELIRIGVIPCRESFEIGCGGHEFVIRLPTHTSVNRLPRPSSHSGSKRRFTARIASIVSGPYWIESKWALRLPRPCSAPTVPPIATTGYAKPSSTDLARSKSSLVAGNVLMWTCASPMWPYIT